MRDLAPPHEDHLLRSSSVVQMVAYRPGKISYRTFDAAATDTLRLVFRPGRVLAGNRQLAEQSPLVLDANGEGYGVEPLAGGDWLVRVLRRSSDTVELVAP